MANSINLNNYNDAFSTPNREKSQLAGGRVNKTRFAYRKVDNGESLFGIEMVHHHGGGHGGSGGGFHIVVACCVSVATGAAGLRKRKRK